MKIFVKTLKGTHFPIEVKPEDLVADVKKNIETVQGADVYPAAKLMLIYQGKVLKDETTIEENKVAENSFIVIMMAKSKPASAGASSASAATTVQAKSVPTSSTQPSTSPQPPASVAIPAATAPTPPAATVAAPVPESVSATPPASSPAPESTPTGPQGDVYGQAASNLAAGSNLESTIQQILDMGGGAWDRDTVVRALRAAFNNPERAVEYLYSGIPEQAEVPPVARAPASGGQPANPSAQTQQPAAAPATGPNANPLDLFPQGLPNVGANPGGGTLDFLRNSQQFQALRAMVQANPQVLQFRKLSSGGQVAAMGEKQRKLLVLYASQTGNALDAAERIGREAERRCCSASIVSTDEFDPSSLPHEEAVVFVVSTTGQGDSPDSFKAFWRFLLQRNLGNSWLQRVRFAVFGLGDSGYQKYNFVAKKLDKRLLDLGATTIIEKGLGDDQHPSGYEATLDPWMLSLWSTLYQINPKYFPKGPDVMIPQDKLIDQPKYTIRKHETPEPELMAESDIIQRAREMSPGKLSKDKSKPDCFLKMTKNEVLTKDGSTKDVRHFEFQFVSSSIKYEVGDVVELLPSQDSSAIDAFIKRCGFDPESFITVHPRETENNGSCGEVTTHVPIKLKTFVELTMDVTSASPRRYFFEVMSYYATAEHEKERLQYFASPEGRDDLYNYNQKEKRSVLEVLEEFSSVKMPFEWLVQLVPSLKPRAFSISSSPLAHPAQVHLTVSVVSWITPLTVNGPFKKTRKGLCSSWLASLTPEQEINIPVWFHKGSLPAPPPSLPLILVGPGTGCAPFRGFVAERAVQAETSPVAPVMFFFGCRNKDTDFLYQDFWESHAREGGMLSEEKGGGFYTAFSRDQPKKVYVQHKIREMRKRVWDLLCDGAAVYVAGSSTKMPSDVMSALEEIVMEETGGSKEMASRWLKALEKAGRYNVEAWS